VKKPGASAPGWGYRRIHPAGQGNAPQRGSGGHAPRQPPAVSCRSTNRRPVGSGWRRAVRKRCPSIVRRGWPAFSDARRVPGQIAGRALRRSGEARPVAVHRGHLTAPCPASRGGRQGWPTVPRSATPPRSTPQIRPTRAPRTGERPGPPFQRLGEPRRWENLLAPRGLKRAAACRGLVRDVTTWSLRSRNAAVVVPAYADPAGHTGRERLTLRNRSGCGRRARCDTRAPRSWPWR
jgi:hypothetical protein